MVSRDTAAAQARPYIPNHAMIVLLALGGGAAVVYLGLLFVLPDAAKTPGNKLSYLFGVVSFALLTVPLGFFICKRTHTIRAPRWYVLHVGASVAGLLAAVIHSAGHWWSAPGLLFVALFGLIASGAYARLRVSRDKAATFGRKLGGFALAPGGNREAIRDLIAEKTAILTRLEPAATEGVFSVRLGHWLRHPVLAWRYQRCANAEIRFTGALHGLPPTQVRWRRVHMALAAVFAVGLLIHVVVVTFFAGYAADYGPIHWWHITAW